MQRLGMIISYVGTRYHGFQIQSNAPTVQEELQKVLYTLTKEQIIVHGSGRTDAGVHARGQCIHFDTESQMPLRRWSLAMNSLLPRDIVVRQTFVAADHFHARRSAVEKTYRYSIQNDRFIDPFLRGLELHCPLPLQIEKMKSALQHLIGRHDFTSFCSPHSDKEDKIRTIHTAELQHDPVFPQKLHIFLTGDGFLYNMVRIVAGTLIEVGKGKRSVDDFKYVLACKDRSLAGHTAPPHALTLWHVGYEEKHILKRDTDVITNRQQ